MKTSSQKAVLREGLMNYRRHLEADTISTSSQKIITNCIDFIPWAKIRSLHTFVPITKKNEIDTWILLKYVWRHQSHVTTLVPVMNGRHIQNSVVNAETRWHTNTLGIPEPLDAPISTVFHQFTVIIVPTLGFDRTGNRLGYGHGHYDRFLATQPHATTVGLAYAASEVKSEIPTEPHDIKLDAVITENGVLEFQTKT